MPNEMSMKPTKEDMGASDGLDLAAIMQQNINKLHEKKEDQKVSEKPEAPKQEKSPLDLELERQSKIPEGLVLDTQELIDGNKPRQIRNSFDNDERNKAFEDAIEEQDEKLLNRQALVQVRRAMNNAEMAALEDELTSLCFDEAGKPYFDLKDTTADGTEIKLEPKYFVIRTEEWGPYNPVTEQYYVLGEKPETVMKRPDVRKALKLDPVTEEKTSTGNDVIEPTVSSEEPTSEQTEEHKNLVQVLIDKTGYGNLPIELTDSEKKTIYESDEILVTSVRKLDLKSIQINESNPDAPKRSFMETAKIHQLSDSKATVAFPLSGFHAQVSGMTYGELTDVAIEPETIDFDRCYKQCSVIYNKLINMSRPPFKDMDDFLKHFAYEDFALAIYGLYVATFPEVQQLPLTCGKADCKTGFQHYFNTRSLLNFDRCPDEWLKRFRKIVYSPASEFNQLVHDAPINNSTYLELPISKYVIEVAPLTMYDYLYKVLFVMDERSFKEMFGENPSEQIGKDLSTVRGIRRIMVPTEDGKYTDYDDLKNMMDILGTVPLEENRIIHSIVEEMVGNSVPVFGVSEIACPKCGTKTSFIPLDISNLVFRSREQQENTSVDVKKLVRI